MGRTADPKRIERFWSRIDARGDVCWPWTGPTHPAGYGMCSPMLGTQGVHRIAWMLVHVTTTSYMCSALNARRREFGSG